MQKERHLILGGAGFIGRHVGLVLARQGLDVTALLIAVHLVSIFPTHFASNIEYKILELSSADWDKRIN